MSVGVSASVRITVSASERECAYEHAMRMGM